MEKPSIYQLLSWIVPGTLLVWIAAVYFPTFVSPALAVTVPDAFKVTALLALVVFVGNLVQALASLIEPALNKTWGGCPSETALRSGLGERYLPAESADRIRAKLQGIIGQQSTVRSLFLFAMQKAESVSSDRIATFNALYAYHRALLVLTLCGFACFIVGVVAGHFQGVSCQQNFALGGILVAVNWLVWYRTRQRAFYYVREVLLTAERVLDHPPTKTT